jgi:hypothetical protein
MSVAKLYKPCWYTVLLIVVMMVLMMTVFHVRNVDFFCRIRYVGVVWTTTTIPLIDGRITLLRKAMAAMMLSM